MPKKYFLSNLQGFYLSHFSTLWRYVADILQMCMKKFDAEKILFYLFYLLEISWQHIYIYNCSHILMIIHISLVTYIYTWVKGLDVGQAYSNPLPRQYCNVGRKMIGSIIYANSNWYDIHLIATFWQTVCRGVSSSSYLLPSFISTLCRYVTDILKMCIKKFDAEKKYFLTNWHSFELSHFLMTAPST